MTRTHYVALVLAATAGSAIAAVSEMGFEQQRPQSNAQQASAGTVQRAAPQGASEPQRSPDVVTKVTRSYAAETTLGSPDYDPVTVALVGNKSSREVFDLEPRDEDWAPAMEEFIRSAVAGSVHTDFPEALIAGVECHSSSCEIMLTVPEAEGERAFEFVQAFVPTGSRVSPSLSQAAHRGTRTITLVSLMSPEIRGADAYASFYESWRTVRAPTLEKWRAASSTEKR